MLLVPGDLLLHCARQAEDALPHEACGLLVGVAGASQLTVSDLHLSPNVSETDPSSAFEIDPALHLKLQREAREGGQQVLGVWHSHPNGLPQPSDVDRMRSLEPGWVWLITGQVAGSWQTRAYRSGEDPQSFAQLGIVEAG